MIANRQEQRVSSSAKRKDDWKVHNMHYYLNIAYSQNDRNETINDINAANGIVDSETYKYVLNPLQAQGDKLKNLPGEIRDVDFVTPIREKNIGEYLELPDTFTVKVNDPNINLIKNGEVAEKIKPIIEQAIVNKMNEEQDTGVPSKDVGDLEKIATEVAKKWVDNRAINAQGLIEDLKYLNDYDEKIVQAYNDFWCTEKVYFHVYIENDEVVFDLINPLDAFPINNGELFIDDSDAFVIDRKISLDAIQEHYGEDLSSKDLQYLKKLIDTHDSGVFTMNVDVIENIYGRKVMDYLKVDSTTGGIPITSSRDIREAILYFKTESKRTILYKYNQLGEVVSEVVDDGYELQPELGDIEVKNEWIAEVWKQVLLGDDYSGIYLDPKPLEVQIYDNKGRVRLPITGKKGLLNNIYVNPIPKRILPNLALYRIITIQIERQMAKYKGTMEIVPQSLLDGADGDVKGNMFYVIANNMYIYDDSDPDQIRAAEKGYRLIGDDAAVNYIKVLIELRDNVKAEALDMANMNESRYGEAPASATVTNNQQNIFRARLGSMLSTTIFNQVKVRLFSQLLEYSKTVYVNGKQGSVFTKDGSIMYYNIGGGELTENRYGINVSNSMVDQQDLEEYKKLAFSASQNGEFKLASKAISSKNVSEIRKSLDEFIEVTEQYEKQIKQEELQQAKAIHDEVMADKQKDRDNELEKIRLKASLDNTKEIQLAEKKLNSNNN